MGEIKSVKVDNWGVFFLQKLQNFFNKTDYCDLTLQFNDNSQLKVHRLVLSACTDFFNVLEQTCELIDDALVMPRELQADVVVPIVNFMYTGTLEFELKMYNKLLKTAKEMNMTVLLKLLEAHKRTMEGSKTSSQRPGSPKNKGKRILATSPSITKLNTPPSTVSSVQQAQRRMLAANNLTTPIRRFLTAKPQPGNYVFKQTNNSLLKASPKLQRGPTRFEATESGSGADAYEPSFDAISYESKPLKEEPEEYEELQMTPIKNRSSPFEQLRKGYNNNKRPAVTTLTSPPAKKPNIEDVKEFSEQQRMRKQIAAEYGDDAEYDGAMDDDIHNDDDDDEPANTQQQKLQNRQQMQPQASIIIKQSPNEKPTIVVKDSSNSKMDHAKIISEVLRQYPHLVKSNKNIKLKIMPNIGGQPQKIIVKKEANDDTSAELDQNKPMGVAQQQLLQISSRPMRLTTKMMTKPATLTKIEAQATADETSNAANANTGPAPKRRIDSKTMHALIAQGAANTTGPWLCLRCGVNGRPISIPSYRGFRRHLINTHKETIDTALCEHCGWHSLSHRVLSHHLLVEHKIPSIHYQFPKCDHCAQICIDQTDLEAHTEKVHSEETKQQCIYCNKAFFQEMQLYNHMKMFHRSIAREDGVIDFSEDEMGEFVEEMKEVVPQATSSLVDKKIKIISDISLPSTILKHEELPAPAVDEDYANDSGPKFVNAEGNEMLLTAEQREEIMSQLEQDHDGGVVMVLNEATFPPGEESVVVGHDTKIETIDEFSDHNIYSEFPQEVAGETEFGGHETSADENVLDVNKDAPEDEEDDEEEETHANDEAAHEERMDEDHMEWAENLISAHDADDDEHEGEDNDDLEEDVENEKKAVVKGTDAKDEKVSSSSSKQPSDLEKEEKNDEKSADDISLKLKMLTGEWTDDEVEDEDEDEESSLEKNEKQKPDEELATILTTEQVIEKPSTDDDIKNQEDTTDDSHNKDEAKALKPIDDIKQEDEISQSVECNVVEEDQCKSKDEIKDAIKVPEEDLEKVEKSVSKRVSSDAATKEEVEGDDKENPSSEYKESKTRRASAKEGAAKKVVVEKEKNSDDVVTEEPSSPKSPKNEDDDDHLPDDRSKEDEKLKPESNTNKGDTSKKNASFKSVDKVKSLMNEWADDDDEI